MGVHKIHALGHPERMRAPAERRRAAQAAMGMLMQAAAAMGLSTRFMCGVWSHLAQLQ